MGRWIRIRFLTLASFAISAAWIGVVCADACAKSGSSSPASCIK